VAFVEYLYILWKKMMDKAIAKKKKRQKEKEKENEAPHAHKL
jgi:hypothetical protein